MLKPSQFYYDALANTAIPVEMHDGVVLYLLHGLHPGSFLTAVLENDLRKACDRADDVNRVALWRYVAFFTWHFPATAWGSTENVTAWMAYRRAQKVVA